MNVHPLPLWFKFLTILGAAAILILLRGDQIPPQRKPDSGRLTISAKRLDVPAGNVDIPTGLTLKLTDAWELSSSHPEFGGVSAGYASGGTFTFLSDRGALIRFGLDRDSEKWPAVVGPLPEGCGEMTLKRRRDTEALATEPQTGALWITFEDRNDICRIARQDQGGTVVQKIPDSKGWKVTGGAEAMVRLRDGRFIVFQEARVDNSPITDILLFDRDPVLSTAKLTRLRYRAPTGYRPVDAAELPDGRLLILNRRFSPPFAFTSRLSIVSLKDMKTDTLLTGPIVARIDGDGIADNYEALMIDNDGEDLTIWIASDDNFLSIQRTLLLRFIWPGAARLEARADRR